MYAVVYAYDPRDAERDALRPAHRAFLGGLLGDGMLLASGPWTEGSPGALILVRADDADAALAALESDPFNIAGLIATRSARGWNPVIGPWV
jgi:uncharacterized protein YciI